MQTEETFGLRLSDDYHPLRASSPFPVHTLSRPAGGLSWSYSRMDCCSHCTTAVYNGQGLCTGHKHMKTGENTEKKHNHQQKTQTATTWMLCGTAGTERDMFRRIPKEQMGRMWDRHRKVQQSSSVIISRWRPLARFPL